MIFPVNASPTPSGDGGPRVDAHGAQRQPHVHHRHPHQAASRLENNDNNDNFQVGFLFISALQNYCHGFYWAAAPIGDKVL